MRTPRLPGRQPSPDGRTDLTLITGDQAQPVPQAAAGSTPAAPAGEMPHAAPALTALPSTTLPAALSSVVDLAEADRRRRRVPRALMLLARGRAGHPGRSSRLAVRALVAEQEGLGAEHDPVDATYGETVVRGLAKRRADGLIRRTCRRIGWMAGRTGAAEGPAGRPARPDQLPVRGARAAPGRRAAHVRPDPGRAHRPGPAGDRRAGPGIAETPPAAPVVPLAAQSGPDLRLLPAALLPVRHHRRQLAGADVTGSRVRGRPGRDDHRGVLRLLRVRRAPAADAQGPFGHHPGRRRGRPDQDHRRRLRRPA